MSELLPGELLARLDDLLKEVRRQGRAAIAAQAAAEACLEAIEARDDRLEPDSATSGTSSIDASPEIAIRWLQALIPVADAIDRAVAQATSIVAAPRRAWWRSWPFAAPTALEDPRLQALVEGLVVLRSQLQGALDDLGVSVDREVGVPIDPERQRIIEVRPPAEGEQPGTVVEVVRPGYGLGATLVREAEVVAARELEG